MHHPTDRMTHTTVFVTPVVEHWLEREIAQWVCPMKDRSDDPSHHEITLLPWSYISLQNELSALLNKTFRSFLHLSLSLGRVLNSPRGLDSDVFRDRRRQLLGVLNPSCIISGSNSSFLFALKNK